MPGDRSNAISMAPERSHRGFAHTFPNMDDTIFAATGKPLFFWIKGKGPNTERGAVNNGALLFFCAFPLADSPVLAPTQDVYVVSSKRNRAHTSVMSLKHVQKVPIGHLPKIESVAFASPG